MRTVKIKHTELEIAPVNFGGNVFGWTLDEQQSFDILDKFSAAGFNFLDTADTYAWWVNGVGGQSEYIIGKWMQARKNRSEVVLATKVGSETREHGFDISRKHILASVDNSLQRLGTDYIDIYYTHFDDDRTPVEETLSAYDEVIKAGKVRYIAASNLSPARLQDSFNAAEREGLPRYIALQPHYNLMERSGFEKGYAPLAAQFELNVFPYWSLAAGFLTGKYRSEADLAQSPRGAAAAKYMNAKGRTVIAALDAVAQKYHSQPATIALAWLLAQPLVTAPIVSATNEAQLHTLLAAPHIILDREDLDRLQEASRY